MIPTATQFVVAEGKMYSPLSPGVTHARYFDQAARTVACIAEVLRRGKRTPAQWDTMRTTTSLVARSLAETPGLPTRRTSSPWSISRTSELGAS